MNDVIESSCFSFKSVIIVRTRLLNSTPTKKKRKPTNRRSHVTLLHPIPLQLVDLEGRS
ncbi:Hypothetical protein FKW44_023793 [Caligus rogercresseyi]|uniref:Uncharacterized protein n=1 Tax=Caligus rogercresseyi TaxID=217165 RepID=A0A7T8GQ15_CALRO|nr:Hypothetical protein FKW44_023793 [Caligus rogercresseyi]